MLLGFIKKVIISGRDTLNSSHWVVTLYDKWVVGINSTQTLTTTNIVDSIQEEKSSVIDVIIVMTQI